MKTKKITETSNFKNLNLKNEYMVECTNCGSENAYHNGVSYECPDCDNEWGFIEDDDEDKADDDEDRWILAPSR